MSIAKDIDEVTYLLAGVLQSVVRVEAERDALAEKVVRLEAEKAEAMAWADDLDWHVPLVEKVRDAGEAAVAKHRKERESK